ncbi:Nucleolar GTP-binding protein 1 [Camellia lanceoleosa]|uniref:Nucleolar GTP-binding protein 1 n=1 Tax=Camellia lanceoleosa TaxID=1840588 RepID=A0ACC0IDN4_9ERIC|nr:Nucleolar GTP-binding protein 1 [Camellia lanceoleosa]
MPILRLILNRCGIDRDSSCSLLRHSVDFVVLLGSIVSHGSQRHGYGNGESGLVVIDMVDCSDVDVRLLLLKFVFCYANELILRCDILYDIHFVLYNFKKITVVPTRDDFIDIILSRTQRQTPTVVHKVLHVQIKYTQQNFHEKLSTIIEEFPRLDDIHSFYGDLLHVLCNKDYYKLALGQINTVRNLIGKIVKDYVKLLKYGDSLYRCKSLKVAALGRLCTVIKRMGPRRTSNRSGSTWQDTPGILDRPFEDRNIIEMYSITALAHLRAAVLFFLDISGSFCNKTDLRPLDGISEEDKKSVMEMKVEALKAVIGQGGDSTDDEGVLLTMSTLTEDGVIAVKNLACERFLIKEWN